jgi:hypothetical protein
MEALEIEMRELRQSNRELIDAVREATTESHRRSAALDDLAKKLLVRDHGIALVDTGEHSAMAPKPTKERK